MLIAARPCGPRSLISGLAAVLAVSVVGWPQTALAKEDPASAETVVGTLVQAWPEHADPADALASGDDGPLSWIEPESGDAVRVPTEDVEDLALGATVEVVLGDEVDDAPATEGGMEAAREVLQAEVLAAAPDQQIPTAPAATPLTNQVTVVMVEPGGVARDAATLAEVIAAVDGPVAQFWSDESQGAITVGVSASRDWTPTTATCANPTALWNEAAAAAGFTSGPGKHLMLYVSSLAYDQGSCSYGLAELGAGPGAGGRLYVTDTATSVMAHELGHNFRLGHSSGRQCSGSVESGTCRTQAYRDYYDVMGVSWEQVGSLNVAQADLLGVLPAAQRTTVRASGSGGQIVLSPVSGRSGTRAVELVDSSGVKYWLEFRPAAGRDLWLGPGGANRFGLQPGVLVRRSLSSPDTSLLLDATPSTSAGWNTDWQTAVPVGGSVQLAGGEFTVSLQYLTDTSAGVQVSTGADAAMARTGGFLVRTESNASVYVVSGSRKYAVADLATMQALAPLGPLRLVSQAYLDQRPTVSLMSRNVLAPNGQAYFVDAGIKLPFPSCALVADFGGSCDSLVRLEQPLIDRLYSGPPITPFYMTTSGKSFFVSGGTKREVVDPVALAEAGLPSAAVMLLETGLSALPYGPPVTRDGVVLRDRQTGAVTVSMGGQFTTVSEGVRAATVLSSLPVRALDRASLGFLSLADATGAMVSESAGGRVFLLTEQGRTQVSDPAMLPASVPVLPAAVLGLFPDAGTLDTGVFVKGSASGSVYVLRQGLRRGIGSWPDLVALNGGDPVPRIRQIDQRVADLLPLGPTQLGPGSLVISPRTATVYFVDGADALVPVGSFAVTNELGARRLSWIGDAELAAYTVGTTVITPAIECAGTRYLGLGGRLYEVGADVAADYPLSYTGVTASACAALPKGGDLTHFLRGADGSIYSIEGGVKRPITSFAGYLALGGTGANTIQASALVLGLIPTGPLR